MNTKPWYKSKTVWLGLATVAVGVLEYLETIALPSWGYAVVGALLVALRMVSNGAVTVKGAKTTLAAITIICTMGGCGTLKVEAKKTAHCEFDQGPPHSIVCNVDGKRVYEQRGQTKLDISGVCPCP